MTSVRYGSQNRFRPLSGSGKVWATTSWPRPSSSRLRYGNQIPSIVAPAFPWIRTIRTPSGIVVEQFLEQIGQGPERGEVLHGQHLGLEFDAVERLERQGELDHLGRVQRQPAVEQRGF